MKGAIYMKRKMLLLVIFFTCLFAAVQPCVNPVNQESSGYTVKAKGSKETKQPKNQEKKQAVKKVKEVGKNLFLNNRINFIVLGVLLIVLAIIVKRNEKV